MKRLLISLMVAGLLAGIGYGARELLQRPSFSVGDCVTVRQRAIDQDMVKAACEPTMTEVVYRVKQVLDGSSASCPGWDYDIEFSHEPDDTTYCLVVQQASSPQPSGATPVDPGGFGGDGAPPECTEPAMAGEPIPDFCEEYGY